MQRYPSHKDNTGNFEPREEAPQYDRQKIFAWFKHVKSDPWWKSQMPVTYAAVGQIIGQVRFNVWKFFETPDYRSHKKMQGQLAAVLPLIDRREYLFTRPRGYPFPPKHCRRVMHFEPPEQRPVIARMAPESLWSIWACCGSCGKDQFMPALIDNKPYVLCYHCIKPEQWKSFGATEVKKSLIHEALKKYY